MNSNPDLNNLLPASALLIVLMLITAYGFWLALRGLKHCCKLHAVKGCSLTCCGSLLSCIGILLIAIAINIISYARLTHEQPVAELQFRQIAPQKYIASITFIEEQRQQEFEINGDEWQLDAKVLKWHGYANLMGFNAHYKLHRLSGRFQSVQQTRSKPASAHDLNAEPGLDIWGFAKRYPQLLPLVDAYYGSAVFLPMHDQAHFKVSMTQNGLIARPVDSNTATQLRSW
ncbi:MAG: hypothetical protein V7745_08115 [Pseudomonadales bacterium]